MARDNVVLEHGMFLATLGRERVFFLVPELPDQGHVRIPTDLAGVLHGVYCASRLVEEPLPAVAQFCYEVQTAIKRCEADWVTFDLPCTIWEHAAMSDARAGDEPTITYAPARRLAYNPTRVLFRVHKRTGEARMTYRLCMTTTTGQTFDGEVSARGTSKAGWAYMVYEWCSDRTNDTIVGVCVVHPTPNRVIGYWMTSDFLADRPSAVVFGAGASA